MVQQHRLRWYGHVLRNDESDLVKNSDHIIAQKANRYIVAFHIAISYDMQRPRYNGRAVGLCAACMVCVTLMDHCIC